MASSKDAPDKSSEARLFCLFKRMSPATSFSSSSDGCRGGTFLNRYAALREIDDQICMSDRVTVVLIEPGKSGSLRKAHRTS